MGSVGDVSVIVLEVLFDNFLCCMSVSRIEVMSDFVPSSHFDVCNPLTSKMIEVFEKI